MRRRWIRDRPGRRENLLAGLAGAGVGAAVAAVLFYLGRILLARESVREPGRVDRTGGSGALREEERA